MDHARLHSQPAVENKRENAILTFLRPGLRSHSQGLCLLEPHGAPIVALLLGLSSIIMPWNTLPLSRRALHRRDGQLPPSKRASTIAHSGARSPVHCAAISSITISSRFKSAILRRISATWLSVSSRTCTQV